MLGANLLTIEKKWKIKREVFADLMGVTYGQMSMYYGDKNNPSIEFMLLLEEKTGCSIRDLYTKIIKKSDLPEKPLEGQAIGRRIRQNDTDLYAEVEKIKKRLDMD